MKRTPAMVSIAKRLRADGRSLAEIAEELSKSGRKVSKASILNWLRDTRPAASPSEPLPPPIEPAAEEPIDDTEMGLDELRRYYTGQIRRQHAAEKRLTTSGDHAGAQRAARLGAMYAGLLAKQHARTEDDGDVVRVKATEIDAAAQRAFAGLQQVADRVTAERATWPRCSTCGQPCGEFVGADKSPVRAMFERVAS